MSRSTQFQPESLFRMGPVIIALIYLVLGLLWIYFSDDLALRLAGGNTAQYHGISTFKGFGYVIVTAVLLYLMICLYFRKITDGQAALLKSEQRTRVVNKKLALMNDITYQDIQNKVTAARGMTELGQEATRPEDRTRFLGLAMEVLAQVQALIEKTKEYQKIGKNEPAWVPVESVIRTQFSKLPDSAGITLACDLTGLEIFTDPGIEQVFSLLCHNAITHGSPVHRIAFTCRVTPAGLVLVCEDDGTGIPFDKKPEIFDRVVGGAGNFHLFFIREFLTIYGMKISETGEPGKGARFEIIVPEGMYRFPSVV